MVAKLSVDNFTYEDSNIFLWNLKENCLIIIVDYSDDIGGSSLIIDYYRMMVVFGCMYKNSKNEK